jgi:hypothetical protein
MKQRNKRYQEEDVSDFLHIFRKLGMTNTGGLGIFMFPSIPFQIGKNISDFQIFLKKEARKIENKKINGLKMRSLPFILCPKNAKFRA